MARAPNYSFERKERERLSAEKKAKRAAAKKEAKEKKLAESETDAPNNGQAPSSPTPE